MSANLSPFQNFASEASRGPKGEALGRRRRPLREFRVKGFVWYLKKPKLISHGLIFPAFWLLERKDHLSGPLHKKHPPQIFQPLHTRPVE